MSDFKFTTPGTTFFELEDIPVKFVSDGKTGEATNLLTGEPFNVGRLSRAVIISEEEAKRLAAPTSVG